jgi:predicted nucleic acid-binding protein
MVKAYLDTNVVVAGYVESHSQHQQAFKVVLDAYAGRLSGVVLAHGLAEVYSVMTRAPFEPRVSPGEAWQLLRDNVLERFEVVHLTTAEHADAIRTCGEAGWTGGRIHDVLHLKAARKAGCERIYTFDVRHFRQLAPDLADIIMAP